VSPKRSGNIAGIKSRATSRVANHLERGLIAYAVAAGAALLAPGLPVEAEIVYTPSNTPMSIAQQNHGPALTSLDLNNDGMPDFTFLMLSTLGFHSTSFSATTTRVKFILRVDPNAKANQIVQGKQAAAASIVPAGVTIGPKQKFANGGLYMEFFSANREGTRTSGSWQNVEYAYVGLQFSINGQVHYGWARVKFPYPGGVNYPSIYGYAYESTANQPIVTGQTSGTFTAGARENAPATLGMLANGASAIDAWRSPGLIQAVQPPVSSTK
jgi:hypothetical protein